MPKGLGINTSIDQRDSGIGMSHASGTAATTTPTTATPTSTATSARVTVATATTQQPATGTVQRTTTTSNVQAQITAPPAGGQHGTPPTVTPTTGVAGTSPGVHGPPVQPTGAQGGPNMSAGTGGTTAGTVPPPTMTFPPQTIMDPRYMAYLQAIAQMQAMQHGGAAGGIAQGAPGAAVAPPQGAAGAPPPMMYNPMSLTVTESKIPLKIPTFYGDGSDGGKTTAHKFREMLERAQTLNRWSDKDTAEVAISNFAGDAAEWADRMTKSIRPEERAIMTNWSTMRREFMKRFDIMPTPAQKIAKISNISQYPKESAKRFYDRLREGLDYIGKEALMNPPTGGTWEEGFLAASDAIFFDHPSWTWNSMYILQ